MPNLDTYRRVHYSWGIFSQKIRVHTTPTLPPLNFKFWTVIICCILMSTTINYENLQKITIKSGVKYVRISYQLNYLKSAKMNKFLPRGIADQMKYVSSVHDINLQNSVQNLMHFAGSRILDLLIIYYTTWKNNLAKSYYGCLTQIEESGSTDFGILTKN